MTVQGGSTKGERAVVRLAAGVAGLALAVLAAALVLLALDWRAVTDPFMAQVPWFVNSFTTAVLGLLIARKRPANPIGWLLLTIAVGNSLANVSIFAAIRIVLGGGSVTSGAVEWLAWLFSWLGGLGADLLFFLIFFFPNGRLPGRRWRWFLYYAVIGSVLVTVMTMIDGSAVQLSSRLPIVPNPARVTSLAGITDPNGPVTAVLVATLLVPTLIAALLRFRHSGSSERAQLKWFAYVACAGIAVVLSSYAFSGAVGNTVAGIGFDGIGVLVPLTIGLAVVKHGLYDIDLFISRTIVYGSLAVFITVVYVGIAVGVGVVVGSGGKPDLALSILATAIVALAFQPLRARLQHFANRLVYGRRSTPYEVLSRFSGGVGETYASDAVLERMARVLQEGTGAESATVWLRSDDHLRPAATHPETASLPASPALTGADLPAIPGTDRSVPVEHQGELLGALTVSKRRGESLTPLEVQLVDDLAHQAGLVLKNVGLTAELLRRVEELRVSRQRLVHAQDEERRRLERNLHDGAQQHLVALKVKLGLAETLTDRDPAKAVALLDQLQGDADEALTTLRDLARGIYPPLLADKGLGAALESQARRATVPVTVDAGGTGRYPPDVEATAYFCVLEALQNVQKYAAASHVTVRLHDDTKQLRFEVVDDGAGFDVGAAAAGMGLTNMRDRLDALSGSLRVTSEAGGGTTVSGAIPVAARPEAIAEAVAG